MSHIGQDYEAPKCEQCKRDTEGEDRFECVCGAMLCNLCYGHCETGCKTFTSGRGGARTAGPGKKMGAPKKAPGKCTVKKGPYRFPPDVVKILDGQRNATAFIIERVRGGGQDLSGEVELEVRIIKCRCSVDYVIINGIGACPNGCDLNSNVSVKGPILRTIPTVSLLQK